MPSKWFGIGAASCNSLTLQSRTQQYWLKHLERGRRDGSITQDLTVPSICIGTHPSVILVPGDPAPTSAPCRHFMYVMHKHICRQTTHIHKILERKGNWVTRHHEVGEPLSRHFGWLFSIKLSILLDMWLNVYRHLWQRNRRFDIQKPTRGALSSCL